MQKRNRKFNKKVTRLPIPMFVSCVITNSSEKII